MKRFFYPRLALINIKKNGKFYFPYLLTCIATVSMFYIMSTLALGGVVDNMRGADSLKMIMFFGMIVIGFFAVIFMFYTNSFLMKRRKKEFGLYNILGMEKRHIARGLFYETVFTALLSVVLGICCGILFSKLVIMGLAKIMDCPGAMVFEVPQASVIVTLVLFVAIFFLILLSNFIRISLAKPIELLKGSETGEKEPKTKALLAILGIAALGVGYYIAITTQSPVEAIAMFFLAVILVIIGTYCLFTSGSIAILKLMKKNKRYYYQTKHFTSISGMIYRMKQNAVGMGNICILSTMVLVMISGTVALNVGFESSIEKNYPYDMTFSVFLNDADYEHDLEEAQGRLTEIVDGTLTKLDARVTQSVAYKSFTFSLVNRGGNDFVVPYGYEYSQTGMADFCVLSDTEYNRLAGSSYRLSGNEALLYTVGGEELGSFTVCGIPVTVKEVLGEFNVKPKDNQMFDHYYLVVGERFAKELFDAQKANGVASSYRLEFDINLEGTDEQKIEIFEALKKEIREIKGDEISFYSISRQQMREEWFGMYGGFLFLGIFLGSLFIMATVLIIYYKQMSEGYDDKQRFEIMQKVGMSRDEVKAAISSQVKKVFFIPLLMAVCHIAFAFSMITKLLAVLGLYDVPLFFICTVATVLLFAVVYALVYILTARAYYKIITVD